MAGEREEDFLVWNAGQRIRGCHGLAEGEFRRRLVGANRMSRIEFPLVGTGVPAILG